MSWFSELAGKAENLLNNLDEQTGAALRNHNIKKPKIERKEFTVSRSLQHPEKVNNSVSRRSPPLKTNKKISETKSSYIPSRKSSPVHLSHTPNEGQENKNLIKTKKPLTKKTPRYNLNHCPKTMVDIEHGDDLMNYAPKRRHSLPPDLELMNDDDWTIKLQNLEVENVMLKNELHVMNKEISELLERIRKAEDGNNVVRIEDLSKSRLKVESCELENQKLVYDKEHLVMQLEDLTHKVNDMITSIETEHKKRQLLESELTSYKNFNKDLEEKLQKLSQEKDDKHDAHIKLDKELRQTQNTVKELQSNLEKSQAECQRLEKDWETYKLRVKSMLTSKDKEIKALQDGLNLTEDTKMLMEQLDNLKEERDELSDAITVLRNEFEGMKQYVPQVEARYHSAERVVDALREALREERMHRQQADEQNNALLKQLRSMQLETGQTIASLRTALRDKDNELAHLRDTASSVKTTDTGTLNVADYEVTQDDDKIQCLTHTLIQKQAKVDKLLAENNMLKIQLDKLECKYKAELSQRHSSHSIVTVPTDGRQRRALSGSTALHSMTYRMATVIKRYPAFRLFILLYMVCLHFWVLTVLFTNTPETYIPKTFKS